MKSEANTPLYKQEVRIPSWKSAPLTQTCQLVGGRDGIPQNFKPKHQGIRRHDISVRRDGKRVNEKVRGITEIEMTSGFCKGAMKGQNQHASHSAREQRRLAAIICKKRGITPNKRNINALLREFGAKRI